MTRNFTKGAFLYKNNLISVPRTYLKCEETSCIFKKNMCAVSLVKSKQIGEVVYALVFHDISCSWPFPLYGFEFIFLWRDSRSVGRLDLVCKSIFIH